MDLVFHLLRIQHITWSVLDVIYCHGNSCEGVELLLGPSGRWLPWCNATKVPSCNGCAGVDIASEASRHARSVIIASRESAYVVPRCKRHSTVLGPVPLHVTFSMRVFNGCWGRIPWGQSSKYEESVTVWKRTFTACRSSVKR